MKEYRCRVCNRLIFFANFVGHIQFKCPRCNSLNELVEQVEPMDIFLPSAKSALPSVIERHPIME